MPLFAILTDDKTAIREIRDFPEGTVFKPGVAFPVTVDPRPDYNPDAQELERVVSMPNKGVVTVSWRVRSLPQEVLDFKAKQVEVDGYYADLETLLAKIESAGKLDAAEQTQFNINLIKILLAREKQTP